LCASPANPPTLLSAEANRSKDTNDQKLHARGERQDHLRTNVEHSTSSRYRQNGKGKDGTTEGCRDQKTFNLNSEDEGNKTLKQKRIMKQ
jgi:hypothetical protein